MDCPDSAEDFPVNWKYLKQHGKGEVSCWPCVLMMIASCVCSGDSLWLRLGCGEARAKDGVDWLKTNFLDEESPDVLVRIRRLDQEAITTLRSKR